MSDEWCRTACEGDRAWRLDSGRRIAQCRPASIASAASGRRSAWRRVWRFAPRRTDRACRAKRRRPDGSFSARSAVRHCSVRPDRAERCWTTRARTGRQAADEGQLQLGFVERRERPAEGFDDQPARLPFSARAIRATMSLAAGTLPPSIRAASGGATGVLKRASGGCTKAAGVGHRDKPGIGFAGLDGLPIGALLRERSAAKAARTSSCRRRCRCRG